MKGHVAYLDSPWQEDSGSQGKETKGHLRKRFLPDENEWEVTDAQDMNGTFSFLKSVFMRLEYFEAIF